MALVAEGRQKGARLSALCHLLGLSPRTVQRYLSAPPDLGAEDGRKAAQARRVPGNRLTPDEEEAIVSTLNQPRFASLSPAQIVPMLADEGVYLASESTLYRILRKRGQLARRGRARVPTHRRPTPLCATAPNQVWTWDITYLSTTIKGQFFYLYLFLDLYSRKIVGWEVWASESADHGADTLKKAVLRETQGGHAPRVVLHSDNGAPMKGATMLGMLQKLGICPSFGRPSVSNDNAYSESLFKTMKYRPNYPVDRPFDTLEEARQWVASFVRWYNDHHRHSALKFVTPSQRHRGEDRDLLQHRTQVYQSAQQRNPERWSGNTRNWSPIEAVFLNPQREQKEKGHSSKSQTSKNVRQIA